MVKVIFKHLEKSDLVRDVLSDRIQKVLEKFPDFPAKSITAIASMENSPGHSGPDRFSIKILINAKGLPPIIIEKHADNLYAAISAVGDRAFELIHRAMERRRDRTRSTRRQWKTHRHWQISA
jgi:ribosome-associated translation inhibitor RaiA